MYIHPQTIVGELVANDYRTASVFKRYDIDYCCNGNRSLEQACEKGGIDVDVLIRSLQNIPADMLSSVADFNSWPADLLADYIEKKHHRYVRAKLKEIAPLLNHVAKVHGDLHPELWEVEGLLSEAAFDLVDHLEKEERVLFPFVRRMVEAGTEEVHAPFGRVENPVSIMMHEHDHEGERFRRISVLTNNYTPPGDACNSYRVILRMLKEFEEDLHHHIHLENNILFPKAIAMQEQAKK
ncbi:iron-sulfur cluster repair di-iron protein [Terrimonas sp. NA20]|uniref:Iron-sulfur cluster repair di-iron protein n=1 Tax=Terrimonas ginsenosidimutans TaxID=2908004 RepID=A0ABS9KM32_9BACT|nr:iron-sulfur cluster repair di-iron protein [Terrimonas ginsenosidimutans]MCG2613370.1 iron-sulfur cluster repair di-iron protein [Terrimonas ginsenosidimutans]